MHRAKTLRRKEGHNQEEVRTACGKNHKPSFLSGFDLPAWPEGT
jgi:hypothetical protein